jgi:hypothetical protein
VAKDLLSVKYIIINNKVDYQNEEVHFPVRHFGRADSVCGQCTRTRHQGHFAACQHRHANEAHPYPLFVAV